MDRVFRRFVVAAVCSAAVTVSLPCHADDLAGGALGIVPDLVKAGALGFAFFGLYLTYRLFNRPDSQPDAAGQPTERREKRAQGYVFLAAMLVASFVFLWSEFAMRRAEITVIRYPNDIDEEVAGPLVKNGKVPLPFNEAEIQRLRCEPPIDLVVDARPLLNARDKANAEKRAAKAQALEAVKAVATPAEAASVGIDAEAGGLQ